MEKPILLNTETVKAILDGRKTQARRAINAPALKQVRDPNKIYWKNDQVIFKWHGDTIGEVAIKPPYQPGDILWVRETWAHTWTPDSDDLGFVYKADGKPEWFPYWGNANQCKDEVWIPSIFMPREAARIFLQVTNVRVERLQDITAEDVIREGIKYSDSGPYHWHVLDTKLNAWINFHFHDEAFKHLWDSLNAKRGYGWAANPWVWVIEFERVEV